MTHTDEAVRVGGAWLAIASFLMILALGLHGPIAADPGEQMTRIAEGAVRWSIAHWIAAAGLSLYAVTGLVVLTSQSRLTAAWWTITAWAVITVGALWTMTTAVAETTVVAGAAASGSGDTFAAWWAFAEGKAHGYAFVALAIAVIAANEARSGASVIPAWPCWVAVLAAIASFTGWVLGMWLGIGIGSPLWVASSILMSAWAVWFGISLARHRLGRAETDQSGFAPARTS